MWFPVVTPIELALEKVLLCVWAIPLTNGIALRVIRNYLCEKVLKAGLFH